MEEVLLGSMSNTVSISSSGCSSGERCRGSHNGGVFCPLPLPPSPNLRLGLLLPWNAIHLVFPDLSPAGRAEAQGDRKRTGMLGGPSGMFHGPKDHNGGSVRRVGIEVRR